MKIRKSLRETVKIAIKNSWSAESLLDLVQNPPNNFSKLNKDESIFLEQACFEIQRADLERRVILSIENYLKFLNNNK